MGEVLVTDLGHLVEMEETVGWLKLENTPSGEIRVGLLALNFGKKKGKNGRTDSTPVGSPAPLKLSRKEEKERAKREKKEQKEREKLEKKERKRVEKEGQGPVIFDTVGNFAQIDELRKAARASTSPPSNGPSSQASSAQPAQPPQPIQPLPVRASTNPPSNGPSSQASSSPPSNGPFSQPTQSSQSVQRTSSMDGRPPYVVNPPNATETKKPNQDSDSDSSDPTYDDDVDYEEQMQKTLSLRKVATSMQITTAPRPGNARPAPPTQQGPTLSSSSVSLSGSSSASSSPRSSSPRSRHSAEIPSSVGGPSTPDFACQLCAIKTHTAQSCPVYLELLDASARYRALLHAQAQAQAQAQAFHMQAMAQAQAQVNSLAVPGSPLVRRSGEVYLPCSPLPSPGPLRRSTGVDPSSMPRSSLMFPQGQVPADPIMVATSQQYDPPPQPPCGSSLTTRHIVGFRALTSGASRRRRQCYPPRGAAPACFRRSRSREYRSRSAQGDRYRCRPASPQRAHSKAASCTQHHLRQWLAL
jgi:hypothetical protein